MALPGDCPVKQSSKRDLLRGKRSGGKKKKKKKHLVTKNLQSVPADDRWNDFVSELEAFDYDIVFCTETWREEREEHCLTPSGHHIYLSGGDGHRGVGICISPSFFKLNETYSFSCIFFTSELFAF